MSEQTLTDLLVKELPKVQILTKGQFKYDSIQKNKKRNLDSQIKQNLTSLEDGTSFLLLAILAIDSSEDENAILEKDPNKTKLEKNNRTKIVHKVSKTLAKMRSENYDIGLINTSKIKANDPMIYLLKKLKELEIDWNNIR